MRGPAIGLLHILPDRYDPEPVELKEVKTKVEIRGFVAHVEVELVYVNPSKDTINVAYVCPVEEGAAVYRLEAHLDGRTIKAKCVEKKKAEKIYKEALDAGKTAVIGREDARSADLIQLELGNMPAGETAKLTLCLVMELQVKSDGSVPFVLPTVFNPRYSPDRGQHYFKETDYMACWCYKTYDITIEAEVYCKNGTKVDSKTDSIQTAYVEDDQVMKVTQTKDFKADHDWSMMVYYHNPYEPIIIRETGDPRENGLMKDDVLMMNFFPEVPAAGYSAKNEIIFIIDRSGSMQGDKIHYAKSTLLLFLKSLPIGCRFNVISFGSDHKCLFEGSSVEYNAESLASATKLQRSMDANMGGTEILRPLKDILSRPLVPEYQRQVLLITDGQVWNVDEVTSLVRSHAHEARMFAVGIGDGASSALVKGVAKAGRGRAEMIYEEDKLMTRVMGLVASMLQEPVRDLKVLCELDPQTRMAPLPRLPPVLFGGQHLTLYARIPRDTKVNKVTLSGRLSTPFAVPEVGAEAVKVVHDSRLALHRLAARAQLREWQLEDEDTNADAMIDLSVASCVLCRLTAILGVDMDGRTLAPAKERKPLQYRAVGLPFRGVMMSNAPVGEGLPPPPAPPGGGLMFGCTPRSAPTPALSDAIMMQQDSFTKAAKKRSPGLLGMFRRTERERADEEDVRSEKGAAEDPLVAFVGHQSFDGSWEVERVAEVCLVSPDEVRSAGAAEEDLASWVTAVAIAFLQVRFPDRQSEWILVVVKAKAFMGGRVADPEALVDRAALWLGGKGLQAQSRH